MKKHCQQAPRNSATMATTAATEHWMEWMKTALSSSAKPTTTTTPSYDSDLRELRVGSILVKRFTQASDAQEVILAAFQEENWCRCIDDPPPVKDDQGREKGVGTRKYGVSLQ